MNSTYGTICGGGEYSLWSGPYTFTTQPFPQVYAGANDTISEGESYSLSDATATNFSTLHWTTSGDGIFTDTTVLNPTYSPGPLDIENEFSRSYVWKHFR